MTVENGGEGVYGCEKGQNRQAKTRTGKEGIIIKIY